MMDTHSSVSPDMFINFEMNYGPTSSSSTSSSGVIHGSKASALDQGMDSHSSSHHHLGQQSHHQHQRSYSQTSDSIHYHHRQYNQHSPPSSSSSPTTSGPNNDMTNSMDDGLTALLSMHDVDVDLDVNNPPSSSSTSAPLLSIQTTTLPSMQQQQHILHLQNLDISHLHQEQQSHPQLPPFSHLHHSIQQQHQSLTSHSHSVSSGSVSAPGTPLDHDSGVGGGSVHGSLNLEQQMRLNQLQQLQQLQNQIFQQQMVVQMELMSSGALPSPNPSPLTSDMEGNTNLSNFNSSGMTLGRLGDNVNDNVQHHQHHQQHGSSVAMFRDVNGPYHGLPTPVSSTEIRARTDTNTYVSPMILHDLSTSGMDGSNNNQGGINSSNMNSGAGQGTPIDTSTMAMNEFPPPLHSSHPNNHPHHHSHSHSHSISHSQRSHLQQGNTSYHQNVYQNNPDSYQQQHVQTNSRYIPGTASAPADLAFQSAIEGMSSPGGAGDLEFDLPLLNSPWLEAYTNPNNIGGNADTNTSHGLDQRTQHQGSSLSGGGGSTSTSLSNAPNPISGGTSTASIASTINLSRSNSSRPGKRSSASISLDDVSPSSASNANVDVNVDDTVSRKTRQSPAIRPTVSSLSTKTLSARDYAGPKSAGVVSDRGAGIRGGSTSLTNTPALRSISARGRARKGSVANVSSANAGAGIGSTNAVSTNTSGGVVNSNVSNGYSGVIGDAIGDTPSPVDLSMPPPAPPSSSGSSSTSGPKNGTSTAIASSAASSISPVTPASIMNLGRLGVASGFGAPNSTSLTGSMAGPAISSAQCSKSKATKSKAFTSSAAKNSPHIPLYPNPFSSNAQSGSSLPQKSPSLKPILPGGVPPASAAQLAQYSNYTHHLTGPSHSSSLLLTPSSGTPLPTPTLQIRKTSHKAAEQKRRDSLKTSFDDLRGLLPPIPLPSEEGYEAFTKTTSEQLPGSMPPRGPPRGDIGPNRAVSKLQLLRCGNDYIRQLRGRVERRDDYISHLKAELRILRRLLSGEAARANFGESGDEEMQVDDKNNGQDAYIGMEKLKQRIEAEGYEMEDLERNLDAIEIGAPRLGFGGPLMEQDEVDDDGGE